MPVVTIRTLPVPGLDRILAGRRVGAAVAAAAQKEPNEIWVVWSEIPAGWYVIEDAAPATQPNGSHAALVDISARSGTPAAVIDETLRAAAEAVAAELGIPSATVRVTFNELPPGRVYSHDRYQ